MTLSGAGFTSYNVAIYNAVLQNFFEESIDFIGAHYTLNSRSEPFWCQARSQIKKSKRQLLYSELLKDGARPRVEMFVPHSFFGPPNWFTWLRQQ